MTAKPIKVLELHYPMIPATSRFWMCHTICWMVLSQAFLSLLPLPSPPFKISSPPSPLGRPDTQAIYNLETDRCTTTPRVCLRAHTILPLTDFVTQHLTHVMFIITNYLLTWACATVVLSCVAACPRTRLNHSYRRFRASAGRQLRRRLRLCLNHTVQKDSRGVLGTSFGFWPLQKMLEIAFPRP